MENRKMNIEKYSEQVKRLPSSGRQLVAQVEGENIIVYQAFNPAIADWAVTHQKFGGPAYSFTRMSWIKPGFLWMMYRAGWATKENQERILAMSLPMTYFKTILSQATISSFKEDFFSTREEWQQAMAKSEVRLQWGPDHDPQGAPQQRKAIQLGLKGKILQQFCTEWISEIKDITPFVKQQHQLLLQGGEIDIPVEQIINLDNAILEKQIGILSDE